MASFAGSRDKDAASLYSRMFEDSRKKYSGLAVQPEIDDSGTRAFQDAVKSNAVSLGSSLSSTPNAASAFASQKNAAIADMFRSTAQAVAQVNAPRQQSGDSGWGSLLGPLASAFGGPIVGAAGAALGNSLFS